MDNNDNDDVDDDDADDADDDAVGACIEWIEENPFILHR